MIETNEAAQKTSRPVLFTYLFTCLLKMLETSK